MKSHGFERVWRVTHNDDKVRVLYPCQQASISTYLYYDNVNNITKTTTSPHKGTKGTATPHQSMVIFTQTKCRVWTMGIEKPQATKRRGCSGTPKGRIWTANDQPKLVQDRRYIYIPYIYGKVSHATKTQHSEGVIMKSVLTATEAMR